MYSEIKQAAADMNIKVTDLLAMSPNNDPFYAGTPADVIMGRWFYEKVWRPAGFSDGVHLRRAHYWAVSKEVKLPRLLKQIKDKSSGRHLYETATYMNSIEAWKYLCQAAKMARYLGYVEIDSIEDHKNPDPAVYGWFTNKDEHGYEIPLPDLDDIEVTVNWHSYQDLMPYLMEIWCEKSTMNDVLEPICSRYAINLCTFQGEASITSVNDLVDRIEQADRPCRIFYISDFDPAGNSMSKAVARKLEWLLAQRGLDGADVRLQSVALTPAQVVQYKLPRTPIKSTEVRGANFEEAFGEGAVELDALQAIHPGALASIVTKAVLPYTAHKAVWTEVRRLESGIRALVKEQVDVIMENYEEEIEAVRNMFSEIKEVAVDLSEFSSEPLVIEVDETDDWLFDNQRGYGDQIAYYKEHAGLDSVF